MLYGYVDVWMWNKLINADVYGELAKPTDWASKIVSVSTVYLGCEY